jgi:hypothetical protein
MFIDQQNQYCENGYSTKSNLQIQSKSHQNYKNILQRKENSILKFNAQNSLNSQNNPEKKINAGGIIILDFKLYYRAIITSSMVLGQKQTHRPMA